MAILNKSLNVPPERRGRVGDQRHGAVGGYRRSKAFVLSYAVADALAAQTDLTAEQAHRYLMALGKVAQALLLRGQPIGIPYLGVLCIEEQVRRVSATGFQKEGAMVRRLRHARLRMSDDMRRLFNDNAIFTGDLLHHFQKESERLKRRLRRVTNDKTRALAHTKEGPIMEPAKKPEKPTRKLMVEDADSVVRTDGEGRQTIHKTPDRAAEAERQGVDEHKL